MHLIVQEENVHHVNVRTAARGLSLNRVLTRNAQPNRRSARSEIIRQARGDDDQIVPLEHGVRLLSDRNRLGLLQAVKDGLGNRERLSHDPPSTLPPASTALSFAAYDPTRPL